MRTGENPNSESAGEDGSSFSGDGGAGWFWAFAAADARLVELAADDAVESSGISTTFHVCNVASGAKDTLRFAIDCC